MKTVDPLPTAQPAQPENSKAENNEDKKMNEMVKKDTHVENIKNKKNETEQTPQPTRIDQSKEDDKMQIEEKSRKNTRSSDLPKEEVFGSLVSLNEFNPNAKQDH